MEGGWIKLIVVAVFLFLSYVSKQLEKKAQQQRRGGGAPPRRKTGLEALAELEKKLREAQRAANAQARAREGGGEAAPSAPPPSAARPRRVPPPAAPTEIVAEAPRASAAMGADAVAARHLETHVGGLESRHLNDAVESRHLDLDVVKAREGHAAILDSRAETDLPAPPTLASRRTSGARLPARLSELQRALVWSEILGPPASMRENGRG